MTKKFDNIIVIKTFPIPDYGDLFIMKDFIDSVKSGYITNEDGTGIYASSTGITDIPIRPSDILNDIASHSFTHVMWFNK